MTKAEYISRADQHRVTNILSEASSRTIPCEEDEPFVPLTIEKVEKMGFPLAELQEVVWEVYNGLNGTRTLLKETEIDTASCPECEGEDEGVGWADQYGDTLCRTCGLVLNDTPKLVPEDDFRGSRRPEVSPHNVFCETTGKVALNDAQNIASDGDETTDEAAA